MRALEIRHYPELVPLTPEERLERVERGMKEIEIAAYILGGLLIMAWLLRR
jgi:hypothetical protein